MDKDISVIIVSYNTEDLIVDCIKSITDSDSVNSEIFVVDNCSSDNSVKVINDNFKDVKLISNKENRGFGAANNQVISSCSGKYILFLNPDTLVNHNTLEYMIRYMDNNPSIGLAGPNVLYPNGSHQDSVSYGYPGQRYGKNDLGNLPGRIACVLGACQIVRKDLLLELHGFDEDFFLYGEDQDICLRVRKRGFEIGLIDEAVIIHYGGKSERNTNYYEIVKKKCSAEKIFFKKHYSNKSINKIHLRKKVNSLFKIITLRSLRLFVKDNIVINEKLSKYQAIYDSYS